MNRMHETRRQRPRTSHVRTRRLTPTIRETVSSSLAGPVTTQNFIQNGFYALCPEGSSSQQVVRNVLHGGFIHVTPVPS